jgi:hypothetical protein
VEVREHWQETSAELEVVLDESWLASCDHLVDP